MPSRPKILVVEDDWTIAHDYVGILRGAGCEVVGPAPSIKAAIALIEREAGLAAAVLDVQLQDGKSFPVADALVLSAVPFVFVTGMGTKVLPARFRDCPIIEKPAQHEQLLKAVMQSLPEAARPSSA